MDVGFIGLGLMGRPMAANLIKAGHRVTVHNRTRSRSEEMSAAGAQIAETPAAACHGQVVITCLADDRAVEVMVFSGDGVLTALAHGSIHVSMSTISVELTEMNIMRPLKSLSMVIGLGTELGLQGSTCDYCTMREICRFRDRRESLA